MQILKGEKTFPRTEIQITPVVNGPYRPWAIRWVLIVQLYVLPSNVAVGQLYEI